ncbi:TonB-dependent receptor [uncultured Bacteroides sp.]|uniref:TonB-dependent receptor n=1 Tax=uncultured Bacteroides sp. TaxID=162156 RepID=UPI0026380CE4|nr:TonB-dependent receptor [uncultured Bacteroides sp.]
MKQIVKGLIYSFLFLTATANPMQADETANEAKGAIRGRIIDNTKQALPGASIYIEKLHTGVTSDVNGFYTFSNLDPGIYTVKVTYVGYAPVELKITIPEGKTLDKDVMLNEGLELQEVVVGGAFQGQRRAINSQRSNLGITNVVSADQVGKFPDSNIGDALKRISGINVQYDQGEARFGQVRGTSADLSSVTINGNRVPSAEGDTRNVQLDLIPADMIQTIEVNKVVTPDMDADAIGGSINLVTKNSPYKRTIAATAGTGYNWVSGKAALNLGFTYGDRFFNDKLGLMLSASYQNNPAGSDDVEMAYEKNDDGEVVIDEYEIRQYYVTRERQSYSLALDWEINPNHKIDFKGIFNNRNDWENRYRTTYKWDDDTANEYEVIYQTKGGTPNNRNARLEQQRTMDFTLGGERLFGPLEMDWKASYAQAGEKRPNERYIGFNREGVAMNTDWSDIRRPYMSALNADELVMNADDYGLDELTESFEDIKEKDLKFSLNFELPLAKGKFGNKLKFGAKIVDKDKRKDVTFYDYEPTGDYESTFMADALAHLQNQNRDGYMAGDRYKVGDAFTKEFLGSLPFSDSSKFEGEENLEEEGGNFKAHETVSAGYIRFDQQLGKRWNLMAGVRLENTHLRYSGWIYTEKDKDQGIKESLDPTGEYTDSYINVLPSLLLKYDVNDDLKVRASFTNTIARPKYSNLIPNVVVKSSDNELEMGNPNLTPTLSYNFDLSAEYYFKSIGLVSAGLFYKKINDFIVDQRITNYTYNGHIYDLLTQPRNAGDADVLGVEVAYQRDFGFIAPALKCIGFYGNYTYTYSKVKNFNFEGRENEELRMPGSPEHTANASLYFDKAGFNVRLSYNFASDFIDEVGEEAFYDRYYDKVNYMDVNASYTFGKKFKTTFYAEATNLLNQPLRYYQGTPDRSMQAEYYGVRVNAGFKINF